MTLRFIFLFLLIFITNLTTYAQDQQQRLSEIDIQHYRFQLQISDESDVIYGKATVRIRFLKSVNSFTLDLVAKSKGKSTGMEVRQIRTDQKDLVFTQQGGELNIQLNTPTQAGETRSFTILYAGIPADGLIIAKNKYGDRTFFGDNWPNRAHHWLPTVDHPADKATVEFIVTAPNHYQVIANGLQIEETNVTDSLKVTHWKTDAPIPTKVMVIGAARFAVQFAGEVQGIPITSWVYPQDRDAGFDDYRIAVDIFDFFMKKLGSYPFQKLANVQSKTRYGGMENAGNIFYSENSVNGKKDQEKLIAHEIAHQWFGNSASEANWHHVWLSEGFATYLTDLYLEEMRGRDSFVNNLKRERQKVIRFTKQHPAPIIDTSITNYNRLLNANSYQKGAWVLHMLRREVGDASFWKGIRAYYQQYRLSNALSGDFQQVMEKVSGKSLDTFFQQWLYRAGHPVLRVSWERVAKQKIKVAITQVQQVPFVFPLEVALVGKNGERKQQTIQVNAKEHSIIIKMKGAIDSLILDPACRVLYEEVK